MAIVVDTCSLVMIAKNYLPLDKDGQLYSFPGRGVLPQGFDAT
ncbi:hypothetical protein NXV73_01170 [Bacteroides salyersiae]|nr:hypothetical protein [Bacteroides salyersiae]